MTEDRVVASETLERLKAAVGPGGYLDQPADIEPHCVAWRDGWHGATPLVLRPKTTEEVAAIVRICAETATPITPQGGNTGLTGGGQPREDGREIVISTTRMNRIRKLDLANDAVTLEAGVVLADLQRLAEENDRVFPMSFGAQGSCQIGGNLSTNSGGANVLRYGNMRAMTLGLEVVTASGEIWDGLSGLRKDNAGYDLKQLFIGSEGTLGIITAATLQLFPKPTDRLTALLAVPAPKAAIALLGRVKRAFGGVVSAFELMQEECFVFAERHLDMRDPLPGAGWRVLMQLDGQGAPGTLRATFETFLEKAFADGAVTDGVLAETEAQAQHLWAIREAQAEAQQKVGAGIKHDLSVPVSDLPRFLEECDAALRAAYPGVRPFVFGHVGDGNLHYNPLRPEDWSDAAWKAETDAVNRIVHDRVAAAGGSITAEHGVGRLRRDELARYKPPVALQMMRGLKRMLDPQNILNPGKILAEEPLPGE